MINITRFVVMSRDIRQRTGEALADYYYRTYRHLLDGVLIVEIGPVSHDVRVLNDSDHRLNLAQND